MVCRPPRWYTSLAWPLPHLRWARGPKEAEMVSLKKLLAVTALGALMTTPAFTQTTGGTGGGVGTGSTGAAPAPGIGTPGTTTPGGGLTPATPPSASPTLEPTPSTLPPRPTESTPAPGLDNPTGARQRAGTQLLADPFDVHAHLACAHSRRRARERQFVEFTRYHRRTRRLP